jgi:hypothetical protein
MFQEYYLIIKHIRGKDNVIADAFVFCVNPQSKMATTAGHTTI